MRRIFSSVLIISVLMLGMVACSSGNKEKQDNPEADQVGSTVQQDKGQTTGASDQSVNAGAVPMAITEDQFAEKVYDFRNSSKWKYKGDKPCIIDFYADWCGPCRSIAPYMKDFAKTYKDQIYVYKVNTDYAQDLSMYFEINAIPAVMFCPMNGQYQIVVGANPKERYDELIQKVLLNAKS